jgi:hypothetical protein
MIHLADGTIIPSVLSMEGTKTASQKLRSDPNLKQGMVVAIHYPNDKSNISKHHIEYDVSVVEKDSTNGATVTLFKNCRISDLFASSNAYLEYTLQPADKKDTGVPENGSYVTILCIDGRNVNSNALIVGGVGNSKRPKRTKDDGQFYDFMFNGVNININKNGEYTLTMNTPIDSSGKKKDEKAAGTQVKITKEGKFIISDNEKQVLTFDRVSQSISIANGAESLVIDKKNKKISLTSSGDISETAAGKMDLKSTKDMTVDSGAALTAKAAKDITLDAGSNVSAKAGSNWTLEAGANVNIKGGAMVSIEGASMASIKGTITKVGEGTMPIAIAGVSQVLTIGNLGIPAMGTVITGSATCLAGT